MDFSLNDTQRAVADAIARIAAGFDDAYWLARDTDGRFPHELHQALARDGWLGIAMPEAHGFRDRLRMVAAVSAAVIQAWDVDPREPWPDGRYCAEDQALSY